MTLTCTEMLFNVLMHCSYLIVKPDDITRHYIMKYSNITTLGIVCMSNSNITTRSHWHSLVLIGTYLLLINKTLP